MVFFHIIADRADNLLWTQLIFENLRFYHIGFCKHFIRFVVFYRIWVYVFKNNSFASINKLRHAACVINTQLKWLILGIPNFDSAPRHFMSAIYELKILSNGIKSCYIQHFINSSYISILSASHLSAIIF